MNGLKVYFARELQWKMTRLQYFEPEHFYLSVWQKSRSAAPLLIWRTLLFLVCVGMVGYSLSTYVEFDRVQFWPIFLTQWGLTLYLLTTGFAVFISLRCYVRGPFSTDNGLPWYVKVYWTLYNVAVPVAFVITIFYWKVLYGVNLDNQLSFGLDAVVHGLNSVVMAALLTSSAHDSRLLHVYQPLMFALIYILFGIVYYLLGGVDEKGNRYVYPVVDWSHPASTATVVFSTVVLLITLHVVTCFLAALRDSIAPGVPRDVRNEDVYDVHEQRDQYWRPIKAFNQ